MVVRGGEVAFSKKHKDEFGRTVVETPTEEFTLIVMENNKFNVTTKAIEILLNTGNNTKLFVENKEINFTKGDVYAIASGVSYTLSTTDSVFCATI
jgi:mannose-6-phosphate isomerase class I